MRSCFLVLLLVIFASAGRASVAAQPDLRIRHGDDPRWAAPDWDDADWQRMAASEFPARAGVFWVRIRYQRLDEPPDGPTLPDRYSYLWPASWEGGAVDALFLSSVYSFELFLDGVPLARGGVVGRDRDSERVGPLDHLVLVPEKLRGPGEHVLALRMSTYHYNFPADTFSAGVQPVNHAQWVRREALQPVAPLIAAATSVLMAITAFVLFGSVERRRLLALVIAVNLVLATFYALIAARWLVAYPYDWHYPRLVFITLLLAMAGLLLIWLLLEQFGAPRKILWLATFAALVFAAWQTSSIYEIKALWICRALLVVALALAAWACWRRRPGAWFALAGVGIALLIVRTDRRAFLDPTFFLTIEGLVLLVFAGVGAQLQRERRRARDAQLTAARMEIELLKKNLQPHFLLNTLTAVSEVIEADPAGAVRFIDDLAAEFRSLAAMSGERLVPLQRELDLCRAHLKVITRRTGRAIGLAVEGVREDALVPPAIFLTLIENGLVHQRTEAGAEFRLRAHVTDEAARYEFFSPGHKRTDDRPSGGTGLRYVQARLEESFRGRWTFSHGAVPGGWETVVGWRVPRPGCGEDAP
ncbi:MAG: hypothetical protein C0518_06125 [Opitutus sp.]|nr:hypothetical protein [Opitutus sp.]